MKRSDIIFLLVIYISGVYFRLFPRLHIDPHLLTFNADVWYRVAISQYIYDHGHFPIFSIRYAAYAAIPEWYPPLFPYFLAFLSKISHLDIPTVISRILPFIESLAPLPFFFLGRYLYGRRVAIISTIALSLTASFVYWNGIADPQSFISFMLPLVILMWILYVVRASKWPNFIYKVAYLFGLGLILGLCFLTHLMYFLMVIVLILINLSLIIEKRTGPRSYMALLFAILVSQELTMFWWLPRGLYWWWINGLVTSSGLKGLAGQARDYGTIAFILGLISFLGAAVLYFLKNGKKIPYILLPIFWAILPLLETQNETILKIINRLDLTWSPLWKPLEGFRFHPFLAQPLSLCIGICVVATIDLINNLTRQLRNTIYAASVILIASLLFFDIDTLSGLKWMMCNAGISSGEYRAAAWFKRNSGPNDMITADYYRSQMLIGVCGGKSMEGLTFPLRNVNVRYIGTNEVQNTRDDVYTIYSTPFPEKAHELMRKYGLTHIFVSNLMDSCAGFGSSFRPDPGAVINREKFVDAKFFELVYNTDEVQIIKAK